MSSVLIVEDQRALGGLLALILTAHDHVVTVANTGKEASDALARTPDIDALICDLHLPDVAAASVVQAARTQTAALRVLIISGDSEDMLRSAGVPRPYTFLAKPFSMVELLNWVEKK